MAASETIKDEQSKKFSNSPVRLPSATARPSQPVIMGTGAIKKIEKSAVDSTKVPLETCVNMVKDSNQSKSDGDKISKLFSKEMGPNSIELSS